MTDERRRSREVTWGSRLESGKSNKDRDIQMEGETEKRVLGSLHSCQLLSLLLGYYNEWVKASQEQQ